MNEQLYKQLKEINTTVLRNMEFLLEEQENQIKKAISDNSIASTTDTFYQEKVQNILDKFSEEAENIKDEIDNARRYSENLYMKSDEVFSLASEVSESINDALQKLESMTQSIENEKLNPFKEAA